MPASIKSDPVVVAILSRSPGYVATELAHPSAEVYVQQAMDCYGDDARKRVAINRVGLPSLTGEQVAEHVAVLRMHFDDASPFQGMVDFTKGLLNLPVAQQQQVYDALPEDLKRKVDDHDPDAGVDEEDLDREMPAYTQLRDMGASDGTASGLADREDD